MGPEGLFTGFLYIYRVFWSESAEMGLRGYGFFMMTVYRNVYKMLIQGSL